MSGRVYQLHSTLELPLETVIDYFDSDPALPDEIKDIDITRRNNTLVIKSVAQDGTVSKYTPTAQLKASVTETRVYEEEPETGPGAPPAWGEEQEEIPSELVEFAAFKGDRETVLQNTALQFPMFEVLCDVAALAEKGTLTAIAERDGELEATKIVGGERRPATVEVVEGPSSDESASSGVNWRDNKFIT
jgi:hypothetical protein